MNEELFQQNPYGMDQSQKEAFLSAELGRLTKHHRENCKEYGPLLERFFPASTPLRGMEALPYLPVSLFKQHSLMSVDPSQVFKTITSSGTTSQRVSRIFLDKVTSQLQTRALVSIIKSFIGPKRLPMIILDTASVLKDRAQFSARGAGILGLSNFGRDHFYALDANMNLDLAGLQEFLRRHPDETILLFGFTFMVWQHFYKQLQSSSEQLDLKNGILIHSGGWKKLQQEAVSNSVFKGKLREICGIERIHNFYGMAEQVGSIFMECEEGHLHPPFFADVLIRDYRDWSCLPEGQEGIVQVVSVLPRSYPGHSLLTEDLGVVLGVDTCPCGRKGKYFAINGRIPAAELRGCSDTYAYGERGGAN